MTRRASERVHEAPGLDLSMPTASDAVAAAERAHTVGLVDGRPKGMPAERWAERRAAAERALLDERRRFVAWVEDFRVQWCTRPLGGYAEPGHLPSDLSDVLVMWAGAGLSDAMRRALVEASWQRPAGVERWSVLCALVERTLDDIGRRAVES